MDRHRHHQGATTLEASLSYVNGASRKRKEEFHLGVIMLEYQKEGPSRDGVVFENSMIGLLEYLSEAAGNLDATASVGTTRNRRQSSLISSNQTHTPKLRDLRLLDFNMNPGESNAAVVRRHAMLISVDPIRAVVLASRMIVMVPPGGMDSVLSILGGYMATWERSPQTEGERQVTSVNDGKSTSFQDRDSQSAFEFHAYEAIFTTINQIQVQEFTSLNSQLVKVLGFYNTSQLVIIPYKTQEKLESLKNELQQLLSKCSNFRRTLASLIEDGEAMALMNLTTLAEDPTLYRYPLSQEILARHDEVEELLESHDFETVNLMERVQRALTSIHNAEDGLKLKLDVTENRVRGVMLITTVVTAAAAMSGKISSLFGKSIDNVFTIQPVYGVFELVFVVTFWFIPTVSYALYYYYLRTGVIATAVSLSSFDRQDVRSGMSFSAALPTSKQRYEDYHLSVMMMDFDSYGSADSSGVMFEKSLLGLLEYLTETGISIDDTAAAAAAMTPISGGIGRKNSVGGVPISISPRRHSSSITSPSAYAYQRQTQNSQIKLRDLRLLDFNLNPGESYTAVVRRHAVILSLDPIRAVIMASRMIIMMPPGGMDHILSMLGGFMSAWSLPESRTPVKDVSPDLVRDKNGRAGLGMIPTSTAQTSVTFHAERMGDGGGARRGAGGNEISFEYHAYEAILTTMNSMHLQEFDRLHEQLGKVLSYYHLGAAVIIPYKTQEKLEHIKSGLQQLLSKLKNFQRPLTSLIEDEEQMALMNLSLLSEDPTLYRFPLSQEILSRHDEVEELLESHSFETTNLIGKLEAALASIHNAEDLLRLKLDGSENRMLSMQLVFMIITVFSGFCSYVAATFGTNLDEITTIQPTYGVFEVVFVVTFALIPAGSCALYYYFVRKGVIPAELQGVEFASPQRRDGGLLEGGLRMSFVAGRRAI